MRDCQLALYQLAAVTCRRHGFVPSTNSLVDDTPSINGGQGAISVGLYDTCTINSLAVRGSQRQRVLAVDEEEEESRR